MAIISELGSNPISDLGRSDKNSSVIESVLRLFYCSSDYISSTSCKSISDGNKLCALFALSDLTVHGYLLRFRTLSE